MSKVIKGGTIVVADRSYSADILIEGEQIAEIGKNLKGDTTIDAEGTAQKRTGAGNFAKIPNGTGGLEDRLSLLWTKGVETGRPPRHRPTTCRSVFEPLSGHPSSRGTRGESHARKTARATFPFLASATGEG